MIPLYINQFLTTVAHFAMPRFCVQCKKFLAEYTIFCTECAAQITPIVSVQLPITVAQSISVFSISAYQDPIKSLILAKSWRNRLSAQQLGQLIWQKTYSANSPFDVIVPVPLHWSRYAWRGYNQAEVIAQELSKLSGKPVVQAVKRIKRTPFLSSVAPLQRSQLIKAVFALASKESLHGKHILLVDDVMTTGSTLKAVAKELLKEKPAAITAVVAARVC
ncbi:MAG: ComF family protein [Candidatus Babeliales bacterium]